MLEAECPHCGEVANIEDYIDDGDEVEVTCCCGKHFLAEAFVETTLTSHCLESEHDWFNLFNGFEMCRNCDLARKKNKVPTLFDIEG